MNFVESIFTVFCTVAVAIIISGVITGLYVTTSKLLSLPAHLIMVVAVYSVYSSAIAPRIGWSLPSMGLCLVLMTLLLPLLFLMATSDG